MPAAGGGLREAVVAVALLAVLLRAESGAGGVALLRRAALLVLSGACVLAGFAAGAAHAQRCALPPWPNMSTCLVPAKR